MSWFHSSKGNDKELEFVGKAALWFGLPLAGLYLLGRKLNVIGKGNGGGFETDSIIQTIAQGTSTILKGGGLAAFAGVGGYALAQIYYQRQARKNMRYVRIIPHAQTQVSEKSVIKMVNGLYQSKRSQKGRLLRGREWFQWLFACNSKGEIHIYFGFPQDRARFLEKVVSICYPNAVIQEISHDHLPLPFLDEGVGGTVYWEQPRLAGLPLQTFRGEEKMGDFLSLLEPGTYTAVTFSPTSFQNLKRNTKLTRKNLYRSEIKESELDPDRREKFDNMKHRIQGVPLPFDVQVHVWNEEDRGDIVQAMINGLNVALEKDNSLSLKRKRKSPIRLAPYPYREKMTWTAAELANLLHLPSGKTKEQQDNNMSHVMDRIPHLLAGQDRVLPGEFQKGVPIGYLIDPSQEKRMVALLEEKLRNMGLVLGQTGAGKTAIILTMIRNYLLPQFLDKKPFGGFTFIDPKATAVQAILTYFRQARVLGHKFDETKVHYFDISSPDFSLGLNLLYRYPGQTNEQVMTNALMVLQNAYGGESVWFKKYGRLAIKMLLADKTQTHTILGIPELLKEQSPLRDRIKRQLAQGTTEERELAREIEELEPKFGGREIEPLLNRLSELKDNPITKRIFGQQKTSLEVLKYMQEGHIVLFNVEGLSPEEMRLVMGYIVSLYHQFCSKRTNQQLNHYLFIDEGHQVQLPILHTDIIPKDREAGLALVLLTQFLDQLNEDLKGAITEISGNLIACRVGASTAKEFEKMTGGRRFKAEDIQGLKSLRAAVYTEDEKGDRISFFIETEPPYVFDRDGKPTYYGEDKIRRSKEKNEAHQEALKELGYVWMARDCLKAEEAQKQINDYLESLWEEKPQRTSKDVKEISPQNKITVAKKEEPKKVMPKI